MHNVIIFQDNLSKFQNNQYGPALFLDRDGVIIKDYHYISEPENVHLEKGILELLYNAYICNWKIVVVTNQSGISKGFFSWIDYEKVTNKMLDLLGEPSKITAIYANGLDTTNTLNTWRKPSPLMLVESAKKLKIDLSKSILIGDRYSDLMAGYNAGLKSVYHVLTGHGYEERSKIIANMNSSCEVKLNKKQTKAFYLDSLLDFDSSIFQ